MFCFFSSLGIGGTVFPSLFNQSFKLSLNFLLSASLLRLLSPFLLVIGEFLVSFCLPVLFIIGLGAPLVLGVGGGCVSVDNIELNFCKMLFDNILFTGSFLAVGFKGGVLLGVATSNGLGGSGGGFSTALGGNGWLILGVTVAMGRSGCGWLGDIGLLLLGAIPATVGWGGGCRLVFIFQLLGVGVVTAGFVVVLVGWLDSNIVANIFMVELGSLFTILLLIGYPAGLSLGCICGRVGGRLFSSAGLALASLFPTSLTIWAPG